VLELVLGSFPSDATMCFMKEIAVHGQLLAVLDVELAYCAVMFAVLELVLGRFPSDATPYAA
jgi:hypothetical protein